jgi:hypothetical protein
MMLKKLWYKIRGIKVVDLDNDGKIESLRGEIEGVFSQFTRMHKKLDEVNGKLHEVITEEKTLAKIALQRIEKAEAEIQANTNLQKKVSEFIVK